MKEDFYVLSFCQSVSTAIRVIVPYLTFDVFHVNSLTYDDLNNFVQHGTIQANVLPVVKVENTVTFRNKAPTHNLPQYETRIPSQKLSSIT